MIVLSLFVLNCAKAQFLDGISVIPIEKEPIVTRTALSFTALGRVKLPDSTMQLSGAAIRFATSGKTNVTFLIFGNNINDTTYQKANLFPEPFSDRSIAIFNTDSHFTASKIEFMVVADGNVEVLSFGVLEKEFNDIYQKTKMNIFQTDFPNIEKPVVISRDEWNANPPKNNYSYHPYLNRLTLHHAAGWQAWSIEEGKAQVKAIQEFHQNGRGWNDIGYHFLVDLAGNIYQGRPEIVIGAHVGGANTGNIGVCILGCYHPPETGWPCYDMMTKDTQDALIHLYSWISDTYEIDPHVLKGHRDYFGTTVCPGDNVWPLLPEIRENIVIFIDSGGLPEAFRLLPNYPNPFNAMTTIPFHTAGGMNVRITITNLVGREIISLEKKNTINGYNEVYWHGRDNFGKVTSSGVYLYALEAEGERRSGKMVYIK